MTIKLFLVLTLLTSCKGNDCIDNRGCDLFENHLSIIKSVIDGNQPVNVSDIDNSILFLEEITSISSESDGNYLGRFNPTSTDLENWSSWFEKNKSRIYWDEKEEKVKVR